MSRTENDANTTNELATLLIVEFTTRFCSDSLHLLIYILIGSLISIQVKIMPRSNKKKSGAKKSTKSKTKRHTKGKKSERDNSTREQPKRSCTNNQTLLSRSGPDNVSVTVRLASAEDKEVNFGSITSADDEEEEWDSRSLASVEGDESDNDSIESIECDDDALPFDIDGYLEELHESEDVAYSGSDAQDGSKKYYRSLELQERQFLKFLAGGKSFIAIPSFFLRRKRFSFLFLILIYVQTKDGQTW